MASQPPNLGPHSSSTPQIQVLRDEVLRIRADLDSAVRESYRLRADADRLNTAATVMDQRIATLENRLRQIESMQQQLGMHQPGGLAHLPPQFGNYGFTGSLMPGTSLTSSPYHNAALPLPGSFPPPPSQILPSRGSRQQPEVKPFGNTTQPPPGHKRGKKQPSKTENIHMLPMVIEKMMELAKNQKATCNIVLEQREDMVRKCQRPVYRVQCFREKHFDFCLRHMCKLEHLQRLCPEGFNNDCMVFTWEESDDWEEIVDAAKKLNNIGKRDVDSNELKQALLPPIQFPHRYR